MCDSIIINGQEHDAIDGHCTCAASWPRIMEYIGSQIGRPAIGQELVVRQTPFDMEVELRDSPPVRKIGGHMPKKHPLVVIIEERLAKGECLLKDIEAQIAALMDRRNALIAAQDQDRRDLAAAATKKPRTKKEVAKDGGQSMESV